MVYCAVTLGCDGICILEVYDDKNAYVQALENWQKYTPDELNKNQTN